MYDNQLRITNIEILDNRIITNYKASGEWQDLFKENEFFVEFTSDVSNVPKSVAVIPILGTFLPLAWLFDGEILLDEIDKEYYECIPQVKQGFADMYPHLSFGGTVTAQNIVENKVENSRHAQLFSGGLDAFHTLLSNIDKSPLLVSVWGADITHDNEVGWAVVEKHIKQTAEQFALEYEVVRSNFREILTDRIHQSEELKRSGDGWWHGFHHGIGMLSLIAPLAYRLGLSMLYIASSYTANDNYTCSSDPKTDNHVRFCGCSVCHFGYEYNRQDKTRIICDCAKKHGQTIPVRVCWQSADGKNCCACEKCYRTMLEFYAEKENPQNYGFDYDRKDFGDKMNDLKRTEINKKYLIESQEALRRNYKKREVIKELRWVYSTDFSKAPRYYQHKKMKLTRRLYLKSPVFMKKVFSKLVQLKNANRG